MRLLVMFTLLVASVAGSMTCYRCLDLVIDNENVTVNGVRYFGLFI